MRKLLLFIVLAGIIIVNVLPTSAQLPQNLTVVDAAIKLSFIRDKLPDLQIHYGNAVINSPEKNSKFIFQLLSERGYAIEVTDASTSANSSPQKNHSTSGSKNGMIDTHHKPGGNSTQPEVNPSGGNEEPSLRIRVIAPGDTAGLAHDIKTLMGYINNPDAIIQIEQLDDVVKTFYLLDPLENITAGASKSSPGGAGYALAGLTNPFTSQLQSDIINGLTLVLEKRLKQLATQYFVDEWKKEFNRPPFDSLFPSTLALLNNQDVFTIASQGSVWKSAFETDLKALPKNGLLYLKKKDPDHATEYTLLLAALRAFYDIQDNKDPLDILADLTTQYTTAGATANGDLLNALLIMNALLNDITVYENGVRGIAAERTIRNIIQHGNAKFLVDLLYENNKSAFASAFGSGNTVNGYTNFAFHKKDAVAGFVLQLTSHLNQVSALMRTLQDSIKQGNAINILNSQVTNLFSIVNENITFLNSNFPSLFSNDFIKRYTCLQKPIEEAIAVGQAINKNDYGGIVNHFLLLCTEVNSCLKLSKPLFISNDSLKTIIKYGSFMADILSAKTSADVENAVESVIEPIDYFMVKRKSCIGITLNGFAGAAGGIEDNRNAENKVVHSSYFGVTAPVGIEINSGLFGLFLSVVDLGAPLSYRIQNTDSISNDPQIEFSDIFSPGIFGVIAPFNKLPLDILFGYSYSPTLRKITEDGNQSQTAANRYSLGLVFDIPLISFYHRVNQK